jgi:penicillin G amidase
MKRLLVLALILATTGCTAARFVRYRMNPDTPPTTGERTTSLPGLGAPATVHYDAWGIPHARAQNDADLLRVQGYLHARHRLFQMDVTRRVAQGRLSELVGEQPFLSDTTVGFDRTMAGWGMGHAAKADVARLDSETRARYQAYVDGVNAAMARYRPLEYRLLGVDPEPWTLEDTFALGRLNGWTVTHNWHQEASRLLIALHAGAERAAALYPHEPWPGGMSLPAPDLHRELPPAVAEELAELFPERPPVDVPADTLVRIAARGLEADLAVHAGASNAWVVGGGRTESGMPLLANDPHMALMVPAMLFQMHLAAGDLDVIGYSVPGVPWLLSGHNGRVAFGMTASVADVVDLYVEKPHPDDPSKVLGLDGEWHDLVVDPVEIVVRDGRRMTTQRFERRRSHNGPLLQDMYPGLLPEWAPPVAVKWWTGEVHESFDVLRAAARAQTAPELREILSDFAAPVVAWTVADTEGTVGLFVNGQVPRRLHHRGSFPVPGWLEAYQWDGVIDARELPHGFGGEGDRFIHANNLLADPAGMDHLFQIDSAPAWRYDRIAEVLDGHARHDVETFRFLQNDILSLRARNLSPLVIEDLVGLPEKTALEAEALSLLEAWDHVPGADSAAAAIFFVTYREAAIRALEDEVDARALSFVMAQRYFFNTIDLWLLEADHPVWNDRRTPAREGRADVVRDAFRRTVAWLEETQGADPAAWRWGRVHRRQMRHMFGGRDALASLVNLPAGEAFGETDSVAKSQFDLGHPVDPYRLQAGAVSRMILDLSDLSRGHWILSTGSSGWPGSPHYRDQHDVWVEGELVPMIYDWDAVAAEASGTLILE